MKPLSVSDAQLLSFPDSAPASADDPILFTPGDSVTPTKNLYGLRTIYNINQGVGESISWTRGASLSELWINASDSRNYTNTMLGVYGYVRHNGSGTLTEAQGGHFIATSFGSGNITDAVGCAGFPVNSGTGVFSRGISLRASPALNTSSGSITEAIGLLVDPQTVGTSDNWAIVTTGTTPSKFGGAVTIAGAAATGALTINGNTVQASGSIYFQSLAGGFISGLNGGLTLTAQGTNQDITLDPSGTGIVRINATEMRGSASMSFLAANSSQYVFSNANNTAPLLVGSAAGWGHWEARGTNQNLNFVASGTGSIVVQSPLKCHSSISPSNTGVTWTAGAGAPAFAAPIGSLYSRTDGGVGTSLYVNETGLAGGWAAK